jgi:FkbM family methyltransferase
MQEFNNPEDFPKLSFSLEDDGKFYINYFGGTAPIKGRFSVVDFYTDNLMYIQNFELHNMSIWIRPNDIVFRDYLVRNGYYLEIRDENDKVIIYRSVGVKNNEKHPLSKTYDKLRNNSLHMDQEIKFLEFVHFKDMHFYEDLKMPFNEMRNFVDAGANFGMFSLALFQMGIRKGYLVEADPRLVDIMNKSISIEGLEIIGKALYDKNSFLEFDVFQGSVNGKLNNEKNEGSAEGSQNGFVKRIQVPTIEINTFMEEVVKEEEVDLFKIDIEGAEYAVFEKMSAKNLNRCKRFLIEFHDNTDGRIFKIVNILNKNGYSMQFSKFDPTDADDILNNSMGVIYAFKR